MKVLSSKRHALAHSLFLLTLCCFLTTAEADDLADVMNKVENFVAEHCLECHTGNNAQGNLDFDSVSFLPSQFLQPSLDTARWESLLRRIDSREMPPLSASRPTEEEYKELSISLARVLASRSQSHPKTARVGAVRRLTRTEYQNAIRDLLGLKIDAKEYLPKDESSHGFDNITVEELSPTSLNRYISAAQKIARAAIGGVGNGPSGITLRLPADRSQESHVPGLPFGTRGGTIIQHHFPQAGEYEIELKLTRDRDEKVEGLNRKHNIDILLDRKRVHQFEVIPPKNEGKWDERDFTHSDSHLSTKIVVPAGTHSLGVTFPKTFSSLVEEKRQPFDANFNRHRHPRKTPAIYQVSIVGPFSPTGSGQTQSRELVFGKTSNGNKDPQDQNREYAARIIARIAQRAFRRPVTKEDLETPMTFFDHSFSEEGFEKGIESALASILVNPNFLFRIESAKNRNANDNRLSQASYQIPDVELASRLSFFLWSSIPDEELLNLAVKNKLGDHETLRKQVVRMLADEKSDSLVENFASQWLYLRNLESITPDLRLFPDFDDNLRQSFRQETENLFRDVMRSDRSVLDLINSKHTYLNERLAKHYGIPNVNGSEFRKVQLPENSKRGGILRHGSILMVTSYATRTSPTIRGNWILENLLGTPAPPPPPNIPNLVENTTIDVSSLRKRLAAHRRDPGCANCHDRMDPIGFSLENYDAVGRWREYDGVLEVDSAGMLPAGRQIDSVDGLENGILERPQMFVRTLTEKLLTFGLGRSVEACDGPAVRSIEANAAKDDYRFSSIVSGIVLSEPFRMRSNVTRLKGDLKLNTEQE